MGIFYANAARTINGNHETRIEYEIASDMVVREKWSVNFYKREDRKVDYEYIEPAYALYENMAVDGLAESKTKVIRQNDMEIKGASTSAGGSVIADCQIMGIQTKEFGETAIFREEWNRNDHWYTYLNALGREVDGVILSKNLADKLGVAVGDKVDCKRYGELGDVKNEERGNIRCKVVAIVENWPGFTRFDYSEGVEQEQYLAVFNYTTLVQRFHIFPYEVWIKLANGVDYTEGYKYIEDGEVPLEYMRAIDEDKAKLQTDCILQITNGLFTLSFIIAVILCSIGFLIYWIASISQRQLLFGIYRAMGLSVKEINGMLANEHFFSTFLSVLSGALVGSLASLLFTKLFALIYLPKRHNVALYIDYLMVDYIKLAVVIVVMIAVCLVCLRQLVNRMDISKSLKLGED